MTGSWASLQSERDVIPTEYVGFDKVKRIHAKDEFSKLWQMRNWKSISHKSGKPEIFVASRRDFNVVTATTSISELELLQTPHLVTPEVIPPYPVTALTAEKLAKCILIGQGFFKKN